MRLQSIFVIMVVLFAACSKGDSASNDRTDPVIALNSPINNQDFVAGQSVPIQGSISDENKIVQVHLHISNLENGQLLADIHRYPGSNIYNLAESFQIPETGQYRIQVLARDNAGNEGRETVVVNGN